ncbi:MarR family transcriptional regulator [Bacillus swezeyi]|uniref:MarR family transcriptional regulator n=1 Tax=Bacillus swezeyi TaxID=1925020 RepID=A0A1R1QL86_9BACI|nr:MarR family transcriptional regulator [Bacillus swezeyi]MEC1260303.1 MarR family transcriptional regulator [Bacillus swezeyi]MED1738568.1 MarR family transcriptional regulator [Bacillus swezeyi]MED2929910.1 MarR family transcriptional regulator [Bacillus swezeyi]MED2942838.1 MarR family transcriptional regulator [Bacillus swezeyi]MED2964676.1 MarR family transcriptional regulator [Bacillus swezeyi]
MDEKKLCRAIDLFAEVLFEGTEFVQREINQDVFQHISREQADLLTILKIKGPTSPGSLALIQNVHKSAVSNRLKKLLEKGFVEWDESHINHDKRSKHIKITAKGEHIMAELDSAIFQALRKLIDDADEEHLDSFIAIFTILKRKFKGDHTE